MIRLLSTVALSLTAVTSLRAGDAFFRGLADPPGAVTASVALGISADARTVVGYVQLLGDEPNRAVAWRDEQPYFLESSIPSEASAVSADGRVIVGRALFGGCCAVPSVWLDGVGEPLPVPTGTFGGEASAVSADGTIIVGWAHVNNGIVALRWTNGAMAIVPPPPNTGYGISIQGISSDGSVMAGFTTVLGGVGVRAFRWDGEWTMLAGLPDQHYSNAWAVSGDGNTVVGELAWGSNHDGARWNTDELNRLSARIGFAASHSGSVIVGDQSFVWTELDGASWIDEVLADEFQIDLGGWLFGSHSQARGISADGSTMTGYARNADGRQQAWIARLEYRCSRTDMNYDRQTDITDLAMFLSHFGSCAADAGFWPVADIDERGCVDLTDLSMLLAEFGTSCGR